MRIDVTINGLDVVIESVNGLIDRLEDDTEIMFEIGMAGRREVVQTFMVQGRPDPWEDLSPVTLRKRKARGNWNEDILIDTGVMLASFENDGNEFTIFNVSQGEVEWGNSREDFEFHDQGSYTEPQRQILVHLPEHIELYSEMYLGFLHGAFE